MEHKFQIIDITNNLSPISTFKADPTDVLNMDVSDPFNIKGINRIKARINNIRSIFIVIIAMIVIILSILIINQNFKFRKEKEQLIQIATELQEALDDKAADESIVNLIGLNILSNNNNRPVSDTAIYNLAQQAHAYYPEVIVAQAQIESGFGVSNVGVKANNLYGMMVSSNRPTTQIPNKSYGQFAMYRNWQMSTLDRVLWDRAIITTKPKNRHDYIQQLIRIYAPGNDTYADKLEKIANDWMKKNKHNI